MGQLLLGLMAATLAATFALVSGAGFLNALAIYSGTGVLTVLGLLLNPLIAARPAENSACEADGSARG